MQQPVPSRAGIGNRIEIIAAELTLIAGAWSALAVTQTIFDSLNKITVDLIDVFLKATDPENLTVAETAMARTLRLDYWFLAPSLTFYFIFVGILTFYILKQLSKFSQDFDAKFIHSAGQIFLGMAIAAAVFYSFFEILTITRLYSGNIL